MRDKVIGREASSPVTGVVRTGAVVTFATLVVQVACAVLPADVCSETNTAVFVGVIITGLTALGKFLRDREYWIGNLF